MNRILEPELMDDPEQAVAYARADFEKENQTFVDLFREYFPDLTKGHVLDLGCGPADIPIRLARVVPECRITGVDASEPMIRLAREAVQAASLADRITLRCERFEQVMLPEPVEAVISNSLLHHLPNPRRFWHKVTQLIKPGGCVLVMDLLRPESPEAAQAIVDRYAANEPPILRRDFYNSLLAAFTKDEVAGQLTELHLTSLVVEVIDDRHWVVRGRIESV